MRTATRGAAWADGGDGNSKARIGLLPLHGSGVTLPRFDSGAYAHTTRRTTMTICAIGGTMLYSYAGNVGIEPANMSISFDGSWRSASGIRIEWQDSAYAYHNGVDSIA